MSKAVPTIYPNLSPRRQKLSPGRKILSPVDQKLSPGQNAGDEKIVALFNDWHAASQLTDLHDNDEDRTAYDAAAGRCDEIEAEIMAARGGAVVGDVKFYFFLHNLWLMDEKGPDIALLRYDPDSNDWDQGTEDFMMSLLRDAARRVPEIAELAAPILGTKP
jgi:hypothetical protein